MPIPTSEQLDTYETTPSRLAAAIKGLNEAQMHYAPAEDEWSIHDIVIHLADSEVGGFWRLRKTLAEENSTLPVYDQEAWARNLSYHLQNSALAIAAFTALRASTAALLRSLPMEAWERTSVHPERGKMSVYDIFELYFEHGDVHLQQIERLKQSLPAHV
jgi:uncharacterized damage-inducible protein DinB